VRAFTLVELLVVLFIITALLLILAPLMHQAQEHAYNTICQGNLEKLSTAIRIPGATGSYALPQPDGWIGAASAGGGEPVLKCPKGHYRGGAGGSVATKPNVRQIDPPESAVYDHQLEDNKAIQGWWERVNYVLPSDVTVDISEPGRYTKRRQTVKVIPAGTMVNSFFTHYDRVGKSPSVTTSGAVTFGTDIIGIICLDAALDATDDVLGYPGTTYHTGRGSRGFENVEVAVFEQDRRTFTMEHYQITSPGEEVRILTLTGGEGSYAMNNQVSGSIPRMGQLLLVEYEKHVADVDGAGLEDDLEVMLAPRHFGRANVLLVNGSVKLMWPDDLDANQQVWKAEVGSK